MFMIVAHRGYAGKFPENTLPSFEAAINTDADFVELDVRRTKDKKLVVIHDRNLKRLFGVNIDVSDITYDELQKYKFEFDGKEVTIPLLEDALSFFVGKNKQVIIELKEGGYESSIISLVKKFGLEEQVVFASFDFRTLRRTKELAPTVPVLPISNTFTNKILRYAIRLGAGMIALRKDAIDKSVIKVSALNGVSINAWIINDFSEAIRYMLMGVRIISTDYPKEMAQLRETIMYIIEKELSSPRIATD